MTTSPRGERRRTALLAATADDIARNSLVGFSLRRAAKAAGTTHKVLLYHFTSGDELLGEALHQLRDVRLRHAQDRARAAAHGSVGDRIRAVC
jgi:AcrR family transcriptional regulator